MTDRIAQLRDQLRHAQEELEAELERSRTSLGYTLHKRRVVFEASVKKQHAALKQRLAPYLAEARPMVVLTAPIIYSMIIPFVILDIFLSIYQAICFPVYRIEKARRRDFITFDRKHLSYLNGLEKFNCIYCSYGNGLLAYASEIAGKTEKHWCPIKHAKRMAATHAHYPEFLEYGDAEGYQQTKQELHTSTK
ncbi:hypothetical protein Q4555_12900 [Octadecabacter sp. 1_MG-2023]|uniref:hypothetical protein n=1 Tax=unclassified Octadecabacter TaxID=196158 RepID=UPI001C09C65C|nr:MULTISPECIES: hypothetical protein [unclassified Octadecabacter]MBU2993585.1 hypothetical protein [Octadecabacter sp. B2R22]MDO6735571.1 hypothetical protein [Octadecabacter sp. 1_MG-2023]